MQGFTGLIASNLAPTGIVLSRDGPPQGRRCLHVYHSKRPQGPSTLTLLAARHPHFFAGASIMVNRLTGKSVLLLLALGALAPLAQAADAPTLNTGSTAWMITAAVIIQAVLPVLRVGASAACARGARAPRASSSNTDLPVRRLTIIEAPAKKWGCLAASNVRVDGP